MKSWNVYIILLIIFFVFTSCAKKIENDLSLTLKEYRALGVPDHNRQWSQDDYLDAFMALNKLKLTKPSSLPRKNSKRSGELFDRMISESNFSFLQADTTSLGEKAYQIQYFSSIQNELVKLYTIVLRKDQYYYQELIDLYIFGLVVTQKKLDLANKILNSNDEADKKLQYGLYSVQLGYMEMVIYILEIQNISISYSDKDHERICKSVVESINNNKAWMSAKDADTIKQKVKMVIDNSSSEIIRDNYLELLENW